MSEPVHARIVGLVEVLETCDLDYLRECVRLVSAKRRRTIIDACRYTAEERMAKLQLAGHLAGKKGQAMLSPEERYRRVMRAVRARWPSKEKTI